MLMTTRSVLLYKDNNNFYAKKKKKKEKKLVLVWKLTLGNLLRHKKYTPNITTEFVPVHEVALEYLNIAQYFYKLVVLHLSTIFYRALSLFFLERNKHSFMLPLIWLGILKIYMPTLCY